MPQPKDKLDAEISDAELNPLLNPILAANMGRWAEVYFTSPPEKRAEAVSELVRQLRGHSALDYVPSENLQTEPVFKNAEDSRAETPQAWNPRDLRESRDSFAGIEELTVVCGNCGHRDLAGQRFCGMCGALLTGQEFQSVAEEHPVIDSSDSSDEQPQFEKRMDEAETEPQSSVRGDELLPAREVPSLPSLEQVRVPFEGLSEYQSEPARHSYRLYVGVGLAILLGLLIYKTWLGNSLRSAGISSLPRAVPAQPEPVATAPPAAPIEKTGTPPKQIEPQTQKTPVPRPQTNPLRNHQNELAHASNVSAPPASPSAAAQNGQEELVTAQKYLNGGPQAARDSHQAANWLWKSVAKQNLTATILLSDLYLRGDGVTKSCDQARLLLDAAARKGGAAAAERLRNLQAFGCQ